MLTKNAQKRSQQRDISIVVVDLLLDFGVVEHQNKGLDLLYLNKNGKRALKTAIGNKSDHYLNAFLIESSDGQVITV